MHDEMFFHTEFHILLSLLYICDDMQHLTLGRLSIDCIRLPALQRFQSGVWCHVAKDRYLC